MDIKKTREILRTGKTIYDLPLQVAYYARVSTDKDDQLNSLENQQHYFEEMITENKNWQFSGGYIDEGISGTAVKHRAAFLKMVEDATLGKIDLILTKEISRFSRNTVDSIKYTEYLLQNGVIVYFISDNLNTIQEDAEFRLTIMSSLAQDEVRKLSERVKFGINRMIKERKLIGGNLTGYYKRNGHLEINQQEAPIIKYLFETYSSGNISLQTISTNLAKMGYLNTKGTPYSQTTLAKFLTNPRYKGYYTARLTEVEDYKTHKKRQVPLSEQIIEKDPRIPALISEELWNYANSLYHRRKHTKLRHILNSEKSLATSKYSCLLRCQSCNNIFIRAGGGNRQTNPTWICQTYKHLGLISCQSPIIPEKMLDKLLSSILTNLFSQHKITISKILSEYQNILTNNCSLNSQESLSNELISLKIKQEKLLNLSLQGLINDTEFKTHHDKLNQEITQVEDKLSNNYYSRQPSPLLKDILDNLHKFLSKKFNFKTELSKLVPLLIDKIIVEKINHHRHHIKLHIFFTFSKHSITQELVIPHKSKKLHN